MSKAIWSLVLVIAILLAGWLVGWSWVLIAKSTPNNYLSSFGVWPVACTSGGCITSATWQKHYGAMVGFSEITNQQKPTREDSLTTLLLQKLVKKEVSARLITSEDAGRYREEVLKLNDKSIINEGLGLSLEEYDELVVKPLLYQEALAEQWGSGSGEELFVKLGKNRKIFLPMRGLRWDGEGRQVKQI